jgi:formylglycine-generating enzyme required for sulfatase activity
MPVCSWETWTPFLQRLVLRHRASGSGQVTLPDQTAEKFLENAVRDAAREAREAAGAEEEDLRRLVIPRLATWDPRAGAEGAAKRQVTAAADLFSGERAGLKPLADALVAQRLLTRTGDAYEVAHEALLRVAPLGGLIFACREKFEQARILEIETRDWMGAGRAAGKLARSGDRLEDAFTLLQDPDFGTDLRERMIEGTKVADYLEACRDHQTEQLRQQEERRRKLIHDAWRNEGVGLLFRAEIAEERGHQYPDTLFHAARAIGFDGFGRPAMAGSEEEDRFPVLLHPDPERDPKNHAKARRWIATRPTYLPIWRSAAGAAPVTSFAWSPEGRILGASFEDGSIRIWDIASDQNGWLCPPSAQSGAVRSLALSPDGRIWLAAGADGRVRRWDAYASYAELAPLEGNTCAVTSVTFSPDGAWIASASLDGSVRLWNSQSGEPGAIIKGHEETCHAVAFSPDNTTLASASADGTVQVWDVASGSGRFCLEEPGNIFLSVAFSPDGRFLAGASDDGVLRLWDAASGDLEHTVTGSGRKEGVENRPAQCQIAFRPDGALLAAASPLGMVRLWSLAGTQKSTPELVATLIGQAGEASGVAFSPAGLILARGAADGAVRLWDVAGKPADPGCGPDLFTYFQDGWYRFDEDQEAVWGNDGGEERPAAIGFCGPNLPAASLPGIWRDPSLDDPQRQRFVFDRLLEARNWAGASLALARLGHPEDAAGQLAREVVADATGAGARGAVPLARSRIRIVREMGDLPVPVREAVAGAERQVYPSMGGGNDFTNVLGTQLVWCRPGTFRMGEDLERQVTLTTGFWLGRFPVTQAEWVALIGNNPSSNRVSGLRVPVEQVSWNNAMEFCQRLTEREANAGAIPDGWVYSLPTEAMWEYACRAGTTTAYSFGDDEAQLGDYAWFIQNSDRRTHPVGLKKPNPWGFYDMHGNVWEWCQDVFESELGTDPITDPTGRASGVNRVFRGGSWIDSARYCRSASRYGGTPDDADNYLGFRLAAVPISSILPEASPPGTASGR